VHASVQVTLETCHNRLRQDVQIALQCPKEEEKVLFSELKKGLPSTESGLCIAKDKNGHVVSL